MTPERYQKYTNLLQEFLSPDLTDRILAEKQAEVIVEIGEALEKTKVDLETTKADLRTAEAKVFTAKAKAKKSMAKKTSKAVKAGVLAGLQAVSSFDPATPEPSPLLVP